ncbi:MAG: hypothetical protein HY080_01725 [Gammaproteobacteria bacterium]|nr:hypothetical protein [Gammaproteobacteria bacterium]
MQLNTVNPTLSRNTAPAARTSWRANEQTQPTQSSSEAVRSRASPIQPSDGIDTRRDSSTPPATSRDADPTADPEGSRSDPLGQQQAAEVYVSPRTTAAQTEDAAQDTRRQAAAGRRPAAPTPVLSYSGERARRVYRDTAGQPRGKMVDASV